MRSDVYLFFDGNCEEAMLYYQDIFDGKFEMIMRYSEGPPEFSSPEIANKIMHATLSFGTNSQIKLSDSFEEPLLKGNNSNISITADDEESGYAIFDGLADGGKTTMPYNDVFWGGKFGSCIDKFGIQWMISAPANDNS